MAIIEYETSKKYLPGYINPIIVQRRRPGNYAVGWVPVLLPYLGRRDLWEDATNGWRTDPTAAYTYAKQITRKWRD